MVRLGNVYKRRCGMCDTTVLQLKKLTHNVTNEKVPNRIQNKAARGTHESP